MQGESGRKDFSRRSAGEALEPAGVMARSLQYVGGGVVCVDAALRVLWARGRPFNRDLSRDTGRFLNAVVPPGCDETVAAEALLALARRSHRRIEIDSATADGPRRYEIWFDVDICDADTAAIAITAVDVTEREHREQTLRTLLREVAHRSKNLLAIVQSIAAQTGRHSDTVDSFLTRFRGRLMSMASSQDLVTSSNWRGAGLRDLVRAQIARYVADPAHAVRFDGPDPSLNPNAALHIGLAVHELVVNSVSYGGLADPHGTVDVAIGPAEGGQTGAFTFEWRERVPGADPEMRVKRFGYAALERVVPAALNGSADLRIRDNDLRYRLIVPATNVVPGT